MTHDPDGFKPLDPGRVDLMDPAGMHYWCKELGCSERQLQQAMSEVGEHVAAIREFFETGAGSGPGKSG